MTALCAYGNADTRLEAQQMQIMLHASAVIYHAQEAVRKRSKVLQNTGYVPQSTGRHRSILCTGKVCRLSSQDKQHRKSC